MNEVLEVLMYLFEKHMDKNCYIETGDNLLVNELMQLGFPSYAVNQALDWLNGLQAFQKDAELGDLVDHQAVRIFSVEERVRLNEECLSLLLKLEQSSILNPMTRELVIDRLMALEIDEIGVSQVKWVTLMVLFNQQDKALALAAMERLVLEPEIAKMH